jgi:uncharacterized membrane protein
MPFSLFLIGMALSFLIAVGGAVKAHRTKQGIYHYSTVDGLLLMLFFSLAFTGQFILSLVFIIIIVIFSFAMLPTVKKTLEKELMKKMQETDASSRLTVRDLFSDVLWLKLIARWGLWKSLLLTYLAFLAGTAGILSAMSQFYTSITPTFIIIYAFTSSSMFIILLYMRIRKARDRIEKQRLAKQYDNV